MDKDYDDFMYHNVCPWCGDAYKDVDHQAGCPNPQNPPATYEGRRLLVFTKILYSGISFDEDKV